MEFNKHKTNKFIKKSEIDNSEIPDTEDKKLMTNIEAFQLGEFPSGIRVRQRSLDCFTI